MKISTHLQRGGLFAAVIAVSFVPLPLRAADEALPSVIQPEAGNLRTFVELVRSDVKTEKALILAQNMEFTEDEAVEFWPLYREYDLELNKWYDRRFALIKGYLEREKTMTDSDTRELAEAVFDLEDKRTGLKRTYFKRFSDVIGVKKSARFFQIENQLNAAIDLRIAAALPLIK